ncbi:MAG TPA: hypothetical protein VM597_14165, partial [Gemmataceae bacterium]|nr:hypothetical protein [Gemmataceae bacterium]
MPVLWSDCARCRGPLPPGSTSCPACGAAVGDDLATATALQGDAGRGPARRARRGPRRERAAAASAVGPEDGHDGG